MVRQLGFTLVEMVTVIVVLGIVSLGVFGVISMGTGIYVDATERDRLLSEARFVVERLNRELKNAVPNSLRMTADHRCLEFAPIKWSTTYIDIPTEGDQAAFIDVVQIVDIDGDPPVGENAIVARDRVIVYPLEPAHTYNSALGRAFDLNNTPQNQGGGIDRLSFANNVTFAEESTASRAYISGQPVSYCLLGNGVLTRHTGYGFENNQSSAIATIGAGVMMAQFVTNGLTLAERPFNIGNATLNRNALVQVRLSFNLNDELVEFSHDIQVPNVP